MRIGISLCAGALLWHAGLALAYADAGEWERVEVGRGETAFVAIGVDPAAPRVMVAATARALYRSSDEGATWEERFRAPSTTAISRIAVQGAEQPAILAATNRGLHGSFDGGANWSQVFQGAGPGEQECTAIAFHPSRPGMAILGTRGGVFQSSDGGQRWTTVSVPLAARDVVDVAFDSQDADRLYVVSTQGFFTGSLTQGQWDRRLASVPPDETSVEAPAPSEPGADDLDAQEEDESALHLTSVAVDPAQPSTMYLAGARGLEVSRDGGTAWQALTRTGLLSPQISRLLPYAHSPLAIYAATAAGVARYEPERDQWTLLTQGLTATHINDLSATTSHLWAATDQGLYRYQVSPDPFSQVPEPSAQELLANFTYEPTIAAVREASIRYADVHPDKIKRWRRQASLKALLPSVDLGMDHDRSRDDHVDEGTFPNFQLIKSEDRDAGLDVSVTWDLGELIWSDDQTSIDVRSKLMVQLRDQIVDEVIRTYFERRRLQVALLTHPPTDDHTLLEKELRLQELTALLDGLTGGYFSQQMKIGETR